MGTSNEKELYIAPSRTTPQRMTNQIREEKIRIQIGACGLGKPLRAVRLTEGMGVLGFMAKSAEREFHPK